MGIYMLCRQGGGMLTKTVTKLWARCKDTDDARGIQVQILIQVEDGGERDDIRAGGPESLSLTHTHLHHLVYHCKTTKYVQTLTQLPELIY